MPSSSELLGTFDVAIVGLGITGISALAQALSLKEQGVNLTVCGIETGRPGERAALANSAGQLHPGLSLPVPLFAEVMIQELMRGGATLEDAKKEILPRARQLMRISLDGCRDFRELARRLKAGPVHDGALHLASDPAKAAAMKKALPGLAFDYGLKGVTYLDRDAIWERLNAARKSYAGGYEHKIGGFFDAPEIYKGMVEGLEREGAPLFHQCKAESVTKDGEYFSLHTSRGIIRAKRILMANAFAPKINAEEIKHMMFYHAHAFTAEMGEDAELLRGEGAFEEEADPFLYVTALRKKRKTFLTFGYVDTTEKPDTKGRKRLEAKAAQRIEEILPWLKGQFQEWIVDRHYRSARLSVTGSGLPHLSESHDGGVVTAAGLSGLGHAVGAAWGRFIMDHLAGTLGHPPNPQSENDYEFMRDKLPRGAKFTPREKSQYLEHNLNPSEPVALEQRRPDRVLHI